MVPLHVTIVTPYFTLGKFARQTPIRCEGSTPDNFLALRIGIFMVDV